MQNRESIHPGRVRLIPVDVENGIYDMVMADEPTQVGTPLRKETLLSDEAAADVKGYAAQAGIIGIDGEEFTEDMDLTVSQAIDALAIAGHVYGESTDQNADAIDMIHNDSGFGLPSKLDLTGGTMKGNISMGGASITDLKSPSATTDAVNKGYVDTAVNTKANQTDLTAHTGNKANPHSVTAAQVSALPTTGGTMTGPIVLQNSNPGLYVGINKDIVRPQGTNDWSNYDLNIGHNSSLSGVPGIWFELNGAAKYPMRLRGIAEPTHNNDAANKGYVDTKIICGAYTGDGNHIKSNTIYTDTIPVKAVLVESIHGERWAAKVSTSSTGFGGGLSVHGYPAYDNDSNTSVGLNIIYETSGIYAGKWRVVSTLNDSGQTYRYIIFR